MNNWYELEAFDHRQDMLREAKMRRLAKQALQDGPKNNGYRARFSKAVGSWLVKTGSRMQVSAQPDCPEFN